MYSGGFSSSKAVEVIFLHRYPIRMGPAQGVEGGGYTANQCSGGSRAVPNTEITMARSKRPVSRNITYSSELPCSEELKEADNGKFNRIFK